MFLAGVGTEELEPEPDANSAHKRVSFAAANPNPNSQAKKTSPQTRRSVWSGSRWQQEEAEKLAREQERERQAEIDQAWLDEQSVSERSPCPLPPCPLALSVRGDLVVLYTDTCSCYAPCAATTRGACCSRQADKAPGRCPNHAQSLGESNITAHIGGARRSRPPLCCWRTACVCLAGLVCYA